MSDEPQNYRLRITERAARDIAQATVHFMDTAGDHIAEQWQEGLYAAFATLVSQPHRYALIPEAVFRQETRQLLFRRTNHSVAYRLLYIIIEVDDGPTVVLIHVRHASARPLSRAEARTIESHNI